MMASQENTQRSGYTNKFGKPISNDVDQWFAQGVKSVGPPIHSEFCTKTQTFYIILFVIGFIVLATVIIVPIIIGNMKQSESG
ncbi:unnamed protein product [Rotaria sordida]|uniref:Uncharacterized protein n=1 Tax=Rotaria sordida TaxID=392033 RepID=A0A813ZVX9_9BILA|nr:unnamed protein product [Rotaria sordida]CAF0901444.1 unnamed protein product [Rotaria sordida]CAF0904011.1 unnamed protein product [Rotaria sordida]CAF0906594.1 unnamed protein product [Rotaria sordida]CAF0917244.1 unnamed protein product [Rotaria sordida]